MCMFIFLYIHAVCLGLKQPLYKVSVRQDMHLIEAMFQVHHGLDFLAQTAFAQNTLYIHIIHS